MGKSKMSFPIVHQHAAGIDVGSRSHWVSIGKEKGQSREYGSFTENLHELACWLQQNQVTTVAMESTGFYWKQLFLMLQSYGFDVYLVNASFTKNIRNKKPSDMADSQWIWQLHSVGLLPASFQPDEFTEELRTYARQRKNLIEGASQYVNKMQKALILMNLQLPIVLSDITGKSGQAIIKAILTGQRDPDKLAQLADPRVKADKQTIAKALTGFWQDQHLFELRQCWEMYHFHQKQIQQCDQRIDALLKAKTEATGQNELDYKAVKKKRRYQNDTKAKVEQYAFQLSNGVDLLQVDGISFGFLLTLISEVGMDLSKFPSAKHFVSWLGLCPNNKVSGGKILTSKTRKNKHRLAVAFRQAAFAAGKRKNTALAAFYRRIAFHKGRSAAVVATARKIAIIVYNMLQKGQPYQPQGLVEYQQQVRNRKLKNIQRTILEMQIKETELAFD